MSTSLYWSLKPKREHLGYALKFILGPEWWDHDGSLGGAPHRVTAEDLPFLRGVLAAGSAEVKAETEKLISLVEKYGEVYVSLEG